MRNLRNTSWRPVASRTFADLITVHLSMLVALAMVSGYYSGPAVDKALLNQELSRYYFNCFAPASPLFILVLFMNGVYSVGRSYAIRNKLLLIGRSVFVALLFMIVGNYFFFRTQIVARSVALSFGIVVLAMLPFSRVARYWKTQPRPPVSPQTDDGPILIVGGAGYIGSMLCDQLLAAGHRVRVLDKLVYGHAAIEHLESNPRFELIRGDCRNIRSVVGAVKGSRAIVHLAAIVGDPACEQDQQNALEINYAATRMLVEVAKGNGIERFIFASSCSVYGATDLLMNEESSTQPISVYGRTKIESEQAIMEAQSEAFHPTILRFATVFGLGRRPRFDLVVNLLTARATCDHVITVFNGEQWRPFIHVSDVARAIGSALNAPVSVVSGQVYNVGDSRQNYMLNDVAEEIRAQLPETTVQCVTNSDKRNYRVSFAKIQRELSFRCRISLREGIEEIREAFRTGRISDYADPVYHNQKVLRDIGPLRSDDLDKQVMAAFGNQNMSASRAPVVRIA